MSSAPVDSAAKSSPDALIMAAFGANEVTKCVPRGGFSVLWSTFCSPSSLR